MDDKQSKSRIINKLLAGSTMMGWLYSVLAVVGVVFLFLSCQVDEVTDPLDEVSGARIRVVNNVLTQNGDLDQTVNMDVTISGNTLALAESLEDIKLAQGELGEWNVLWNPIDVTEDFEVSLSDLELVIDGASAKMLITSEVLSYSLGRLQNGDAIKVVITGSAGNPDYFIYTETEDTDR